MPKIADADPPDLPVVLTRTQALASGFTPDEIRQRLRSGRWFPLAVGVYRRECAPAFLDPFVAERQAHRELAYAAAMRHPGAVIAIESAAIVHGMPLVSPTPRRPTLIGSIGTRRDDRMAHLHRRALREDEVMEAEPGLWITTPLRTWIDITRRGALPDSLSTGDGAVRAGLLTGEQAQQQATVVRGRHCRLVRSAAQLLDGTRETALESYSFARFVQWGIDLPEMQVEIRDRFGAFLGRVDFLWRAQGLIGEADGAWKYGTQHVLYDEKRREDALRALGYRVIRWGWRDLGARAGLYTDLLTALNSSRVRPQAS